MGRMTAYPLTDELTALRAVQDDVVSRGQLRDLGYDRWAVSRRIRGQRWQAAGARAIICHTGPISTRQRWWCAVLNTSPHAVLAGATAAEAAGLTGFEDDALHVVVAKGSRPAHPDGVVVHESRRLLPDDIHPAVLPPRTRTARSVADAALWTPTAARACAILAAAVQQRITTPAASLEVLDTIRRHRHLRVLRSVLVDIDGGAQALSELRFTRLCRAAGLPEPVRQAVRADSRGRRRYLDADWPAYGLSVEIDGIHHEEVHQWWADQDRDNETTLGGSRVLRFPGPALYTDPDRVLDQVRRGLEAGGWRSPRLVSVRP